MKKFEVQKVYLIPLILFSIFIVLPGRGECKSLADAVGATVSSTVPANAATGTAIGSKLAVTFSEAMDAATLSATTFTLKHGTTPVSGRVTYSGVTANFAPDNGLVAGTVYSAAISTGVKDLAGNALARSYAWSFTTGATRDATKPKVTDTTPANVAAAAPVGSKLSATFSEALDPATVTTSTFTLQQGGAAVSGTVAYSGVTAVFAPASYLLAGTLYTATVSTGAKDLAGNQLANNYVWSFTTGTAQDTQAPQVALVTPASFATGVCVNKTIAATFSEAMDPLTVNTATFSLQQGATAVPGTVVYSGLTAVFTPTSNLLANTGYSATISFGAHDLAGNALARNQVWSFTTDAALCLAPVNLGSAGNFVILAKTGVSTTGTTAVVGDVGASPVAATYLTGFSLIADASNTFSTSSYVVGKLYAADYATPTPAVMTTAISDMETAFTDAAGRTTPDFTELGAGDISGMTLVPGLYKWGTGVLLTNAGVTLSGGPDDVWIFQIAGNLTVNNSAMVTLIGGAQAKNVFWQISGHATLGTNADFKGIVLSQTLISLNTGAKMKGRALAQTAVTLNATAITAP
jgi:methionine-rich copper-binding protein CopC